MTRIICINGKKLTKGDLEAIKEFEEYRKQRHQKQSLKARRKPFKTQEEDALL